MKTVEINGVRFNVEHNTKKQPLEEGIITTTFGAVSGSILSPGTVNEIVSSHLSFWDIASLILRILKLLKKNDKDTTITRMLKYVIAIGPMSFVFLYLLTSKKIANIAGPLILKIVEIFSSPLVSGFTKIMFKFINKVSGTFIGTIIVMILLPVIAFINILIGLLTKSNEGISKIFSMNDIKNYNRKLFSIYKIIGSKIVDIVPIIRPFVNFIGKIFKAIFNFASIGMNKVSSFLNRAKSEEKVKTESGGIIGIISAMFTGFLMGVLKKVKIMGIFGLIVTLGIKFSSKFRTVLMNIPVINKLIPMIISAGAMVASKLKLNTVARALKDKHTELKELTRTVGVVNAIST